MMSMEWLGPRGRAAYAAEGKGARARPPSEGMDFKGVPLK